MKKWKHLILGVILHRKFHCPQYHDILWSHLFSAQSPHIPFALPIPHMDFAKMVFMYYIIIIPMKLFLHTAELYMAPITTSHLFFSIYIAKANENVDSILLYS